KHRGSSETCQLAFMLVGRRAMEEPKTQCTVCGVTILQQAADERSGLCRPRCEEFERDLADQDAAAYSRWHDRLLSFASECRRVAPAPSVESLTTTERIQYGVLRASMALFSETRDVVRNDDANHVAILGTSRIGLGAAEDVFRGPGTVV